MFSSLSLTIFLYFSLHTALSHILLISCSLLPEPVPGMVICYVTIPGISASQPVPPMSLYLSLSRSDSHLPPHQQCPVDPMEFDPRSPPSSMLLSCLIRWNLPTERGRERERERERVREREKERERERNRKKKKIRRGEKEREREWERKREREEEKEKENKTGREREREREVTSLSQYCRFTLPHAFSYLFLSICTCISSHNHLSI